MLPGPQAQQSTDTNRTHLRKGLGLGVVLVGVAGDAVAFEKAHGDGQRPLLHLSVVLSGI